jgi:hypothetical protein
MSQQLCDACVFFSPAHTCIEKPTWGHCLKLVKARPDWGAQKLRPFFTWADNHCDDFQPRQPSVVRS